MAAIRVTRDEHRSIEAVMHALTHLARAAQDPAVRPGFEVLRAMIYYIAEYPERLHHQKEDGQLFARLAARAPEAKPLLDELIAEHASGAPLRRGLEPPARAFEAEWEGGEGGGGGGPLPEPQSGPAYGGSLGIGLLIGLERERNPAAKAGVRTFAL